MAITPCLAMTAAEFANAPALPPNIAWMACHFSPYSTGLSNFPVRLPEDSILLVNDVTPIHKHDPEIIADQLKQCIQQLHCRAVILDFQRQINDNILGLTELLLKALSCSTVVPKNLAKDFSCPVFLPPCPLHIALEEHVAQWQDREIWLEISNGTSEITLTKAGAAISEVESPNSIAGGFYDAYLHCHYCIEVLPQNAKFTLWRTGEDWEAFLQHAEDLGIKQTIGLYQEFQDLI